MSDKYDLTKISRIKDGMKNALDLNDADQAKGQLKEKDFYQELDRTKKGSCCSVPILVVFFALLFFGIIYSLFLLKEYTQSGIEKIANNNQNHLELAERFSAEINNLQTGQTLSLDFSEVEIANYLGIADPDFPLKKTRLKVSEQGISISGKTSDNLISLPITAVVRPKIQENRLSFVLDDLASGSVSLPNSIKQDINAYLERLMKTRELYDTTLEIISASTSEGVLTIEVSKK